MECTFRKPVNNISISTYERSFKRKGDQTSKGRSFSSCIAPKPPRPTLVQAFWVQQETRGNVNEGE
jgi:hypothetical protein